MTKQKQQRRNIPYLDTINIFETRKSQDWLTGLNVYDPVLIFFPLDGVLTAHNFEVE